jgi:phage recombination protein Bet
MTNGNSSSPAPFLLEEQRQILRKSALCAKLNDDQANYFFQVVERTRLDPFTGQIRPDVRQTTQPDGSKQPTMLILVTLQGLRGIGERTGQHDGESPIEWCGTNGEWVTEWLADVPPVAARSSVFRKDRSHPQISVVRFDAFCQYVYDKGGKLTPNPFWKRMGSHMLGKCSLAGAYRGAYPNQCSGVYINEEIGEELDSDSEEAIEAEMLRRAQSEKEYWDKEREKGNLPIDEQQKLEKEKSANGPKKSATAPKTSGKAAETSAPVKTGSDLFPKPPAIRSSLLSEQQTPPTKTEVPPSTADLLPSKTEDASWQAFRITRITALKDRTVMSLNATELEALKPWMERVKGSWGNIDQDYKDHYAAIQARIDSDAEFEQLTNSLDFGPRNE